MKRVTAHDVACAIARGGIIGIVLGLGVVHAQEAQDLKRRMVETLEQLAALVKQLPDPPPPVTVVRAGESLQAALDKGGTIELQPGAIFAGTRFTVSKSGTILKGQGATLTTTAGPALAITPDVDDVEIEDVTLASAWSGAVLQCGDNGPTQTAIAQQPERITLRRIHIPTHRGKRGIELNCSATVVDSHVLDVYSAAGDENQALWVGNSCGPVTVLGGDFVGASENIMVGGDVMKMPCLPSVLVFDGVTLTKPDAWRGKVPVKNLFELKAGRSVILRNAWLSNNWVSGQEGTAITITPRNGAYIQDVLIDTVTVDRVSLGLQVLGKDNKTVTPEATSGVVVRNSSFAISKASQGGRGVLALLVTGVLDVSFENVDATFDGPALFVADSLVPQGPVTMRDSRTGLGTYAIQAPGANFGNVPTGSYVGRELAVILERNVFTPGPAMSSTGLAAVKKNFPANTFTR